MVKRIESNTRLAEQPMQGKSNADKRLLQIL
jgi:hypothetical protein